ncbi:sulfatase-like hydrolase/transferase [Porphyromonas sp.]
MKTAFKGSLGAYGKRWRGSLWLPVLFVLSQLVLSLSALYYSVLPMDNDFLHEAFSVARYLIPRFLGWGLLLSMLYAIPKQRWWKYILGGVFILLILLCFAYEFFLVRMYHVLYSNVIADIILSSNRREGMEFLRALWGNYDCFLILALLFLWLLVAWGIRYLLKRWEANWAVWTKPVFIISLLVSIYGIGSFQISSYEQYHNRLTLSSVRSSSLERLFWETKLSLLKEEEIFFAQAYMQKSYSQLNLVVEESPFKSPIQVILILGESTTTHYMHGYGYPLPTTPQLDSLESLGEIVRFSDVVSPAASTILSNTRSLTYYTMEEGGKPWYEYPTLLGVMRKAGYYTAWLTAQDAMGMHSMVSTFGKSADTLLGIPGTIPEEISEYYGASLPPRLDDQLFDLLLTMKDIPQEKGALGLFEVLHLMGCHEMYRERYPSTFARFTPKDLPHRLGGEKDVYIAEYLNAVYYNDYVVSSIIERYKREPVLLFYFSDHGEVVYNDSKHPDFKGRSSRRVGVSIPFYVYMSPLLREQQPQLWKRIQAVKNFSYETDLFTHTLTGLLGIKTKYSQPRYELFNSSYDANRLRMIWDYSGRSLPLSN